MPIYEYRCAACDDSFEALLKVGSKAPACPRCSGAQVSRELSVFAPSVAAAGGSARPPAPSLNGRGGAGCCGGGCGCH